MSVAFSPRETAQMILVQITEHPETHDQEYFEESRVCLTTRCVAGWAQFFHDGHVARRPSRAGQLYLGLSDEDAEILFFGTTNKQAVAALIYLANGLSIDWDVVWETE